MAGPRRWDVLDSEKIQDCRVFSVHRTRMRSPRTGGAHDFFRIEATDWVNVIALTREREVVMVRQFRQGALDLTLETPGGMVDPGETPAEAAARELLEESGYAPGDLVALGSVNPNPALFANRLHGFLVRDARRVAEVRNESTEETHVELVPLDALAEQVRAGRIDHALVVAVFHLWELSGERARQEADS